MLVGWADPRPFVGGRRIHELEERGLAEHFVQANDKLARFEGRLEEQDERLEEMTRRLERVESRG